MALRFGPWLTAGVFGLVVLTSVFGCNKSSSSSNAPGNESFVVLGPPDVDVQTGAITDAGLSKIKQASNEPSVTIRVSGHAQISDAGLAQLAQFKNVRRVMAQNSRVTQAGIDKLKKSLPEVVVDK